MAKKFTWDKKRLRQDTERLLRRTEGVDRKKILAIIDGALADIPGAHNVPPAGLLKTYKATERTELADIAAEDLVETRLKVFSDVGRFASERESSPEGDLGWILRVLGLYGKLLRNATDEESWLEEIVRGCGEVAASPAKLDAEGLRLFFALGWKAQGFLKARAQQEDEVIRAARSKAGRSTSKAAAAWWDELIDLVKGLRQQDPALTRGEILDLVMEHEAKAVEGGIITKAHKPGTLARKLAQHLPASRSRKSRQT